MLHNTLFTIQSIIFNYTLIGGPGQSALTNIHGCWLTPISSSCILLCATHEHARLFFIVRSHDMYLLCIAVLHTRMHIARLFSTVCSYSSICHLCNLLCATHEDAQVFSTVRFHIILLFYVLLLTCSWMQYRPAVPCIAVQCAICTDLGVLCIGLGSTSMKRRDKLHQCCLHFSFWFFLDWGHIWPIAACGPESSDVWKLQSGEIWR